jgi:hypothetical protein
MVIEHSELQYRHCQGGTRMWKTLGRYGEGGCEGLLEHVTPVDFFEFRLKLKTPMGWGEWSDVSEKMQSQPEIPSKLCAPVHGLITTAFMCIYWRPNDDNGAPILQFILERKERGGQFQQVFFGSGMGKVTVVMLLTLPRTVTLNTRSS